MNLMSIERYIPCLLVSNGGLYKTVKFKSPSYLGDPVNAVKIFSDKEADEIIILDIEASRNKRGPDYELIGNIAAQAFMPVAYGGGVSSLDQMNLLYSLGIEKVVLNSWAHHDNSFVQRAATEFGSQSVIVCLDCKKPFLSKSYAVYTLQGRRRVYSSVLEAALLYQSLGAGELVLNNIDRDGTMSGYDHELLAEVSSKLSIPVIALGGASSLEDMKSAIRDTGVAGAAAGSLFSFRWPERAVLINYPKNRF
jgi:imidazole glycerol-phosphate synthase subunit HisF